MGITQLMLPDEQAPSLKSIETTANALASSVLVASSRKNDQYDAYVTMVAAADQHGHSANYFTSLLAKVSSYCQSEVAKHYMQVKCTTMPNLRSAKQANIT